MMANPTVTVTLTPKSATEIDFTGTVTGLVASEAVTVQVAAIVGVTGAVSATATTLAVTPPPPPPPSAVTWNANTSLALSADKTTVSNLTGLKDCAVTSVALKASEVQFWDVLVIKGGPNLAVGLADANFPLTGEFVGQDGNAMAFYTFDPSIPLTDWLNNKEVVQPQTTVTLGPDVNGATYHCAYNGTKHSFFLQSPEMAKVFGANAWNDNPNADPMTGVGGVDCTPLGTGSLFPIVGLVDSGSSVQLVLPALASLPTGGVVLGT